MGTVLFSTLWFFSRCWCFLREGNGTPHQYSCLENPMDGGAWWAAVHGVAKSRTRLSNFTFTFHFHALEKETATHSSVLAWRIPGMGEPGGLLSMGSHRVGHDWSDLAAAAILPGCIRNSVCVHILGWLTLQTLNLYTLCKYPNVRYKKDISSLSYYDQIDKCLFSYSRRKKILTQNFEVSFWLQS